MKKSNKKTGITAIYVRRSVSDKDKGNNSLSINTQKEECVKFVGEKSTYRIYCDDGKSGKDIQHRPAFQEMMQDARDGMISRIVVKKYDRFSRNMREYLNITDELDATYGGIRPNSFFDMSIKITIIREVYQMVLTPELAIPKRHKVIT